MKALLVEAICKHTCWISNRLFAGLEEWQAALTNTWLGSPKFSGGAGLGHCSGGLSLGASLAQSPDEVGWAKRQSEALTSCMLDLLPWLGGDFFPVKQITCL